MGIGVSKNVGKRLPKIGSLFSPELTMQLYKYSMLNTNKFHQKLITKKVNYEYGNRNSNQYG